MTTWTSALAYASALISSTVTFALGYGLAPLRATFLAASTTLAVFVVAVAVVALLRWSRPRREAWHRARAEAVRDAAEDSGIYTWIAVVWAVVSAAAMLASATLGGGVGGA